MRIRRFTLGLALLLSGACAPVVRNTRAWGSHVPQNVLTQRDLDRVMAATDLFDAIESLTPNFIWSRGEMAGVAVDGILIGSAERMRHMDHRTVVEVRKITGPDAFLRFGSRAPATVLLLTTRRH
jgi:hypothetical protein